MLGLGCGVGLGIYFFIILPTHYCAVFPDSGSVGGAVGSPQLCGQSARLQYKTTFQLTSSRGEIECEESEQML